MIDGSEEERGNSGISEFFKKTTERSSDAILRLLAGASLTMSAYRDARAHLKGIVNGYVKM